jgi:regulator of protease activity HflC (stomatin/prohibitin superfamily)
MISYSNSDNYAAKVGCGILAFVVVLLVFIVAGPWAMAFNSTDAGHVAIVRAGGWFGGNGIIGIIDPAHKVTNTGLYTTLHEYPSQQRTYTISADPKQGDAPGVDVVSTPSSDGVQMGIEGTVYYQLNLDHGVLTKFDNVYGTRAYAFNNDSYHAYDGDDGWGAFMNTQVRPTIDSAIRQAVADHACSELNATCALVKDSTQLASLAKGQSTNVNYAAVESTINADLARDINAQLGADPNNPKTWYLTGIRFTLRKADIPQNVQDAANNALAAFAQVSQKQAEVQQAQLDAQANAARQQGYNACPTCQIIDELKALPPNLTTYAPGAGGVAVGAK